MGTSDCHRFIYWSADVEKLTGIDGRTEGKKEGVPRPVPPIPIFRIITSLLSRRLKAVHTCDGIGSRVGIGSARSVTIQCKLNNGIGSGVRRSTESESEGSEEFLFLPIPLLLPSLPIQ